MDDLIVLNHIGSICPFSLPSSSNLCCICHIKCRLSSPHLDGIYGRTFLSFRFERSFLDFCFVANGKCTSNVRRSHIRVSLGFLEGRERSSEVLHPKST